MNTRKINLNRMTATALVALFAMATPAFAWMGNWSGYDRGPTAGTSTLSAEQQKRVDAVQSKYQPQLDDLQQKLDAKSSELRAARSDGNATVAQLNTLESDLSQLERQYWALLDQANAEAVRITGTGYGPYFTCGYMGRNYPGPMGPRMGGRYNGYNRYNNHYCGCCW